MLIILYYSVAFGCFISERRLETIPLGKWGVGAKRMKEICALHKSEFMRQIDERRLLIICCVQVPFWAKGEIIPINGEISPIFMGIPQIKLKIRRNFLLAPLVIARSDSQQRLPSNWQQCQPLD